MSFNTQACLNNSMSCKLRRSVCFATHIDRAEKHKRKSCRLFSFLFSLVVVHVHQQNKKYMLSIVWKRQCQMPVLGNGEHIFIICINLVSSWYLTHSRIAITNNFFHFSSSFFPVFKFLIESNRWTFRIYE